MTHAPEPKSGRSTDRWENEGGPTGSPAMQRPNVEGDLKKFGITTVHLTVFDWSGYRYSNATDAIAAARRAKAKEPA